MSSSEEQWDICHILYQRGVVFTHLLDKNHNVPHDTMVVFGLGDTYYSIALAMVKTIQVLEDYQPLPLTHATIVGVIMALGRPLIVLDIRPQPRMSDVVASPAGKPVIVAGRDGAEVGLVVDELITVPGFAHTILPPTVAHYLPPGKDAEQEHGDA